MSEIGDLSQFEARVIQAAEHWAANRGLAGIFPPREGTPDHHLFEAVRSLQAQRQYEREQSADVCTCPRDRQQYCAAKLCQGGLDVPQWVPGTWVDVRQGDLIRAPGHPGSEATVVSIGGVNRWHAAPNANQYRPNESPAEWSAIPVTLAALNDPTGRTFSPEHGMRPDAGVEISLTPAELSAIELLGGWQNRIAVHEKDVTVTAPHPTTSKATEGSEV